MEDRLEKYRPLFIGGEWVESIDGKTDDDINPATGKTIAKVAVAVSKGRRARRERRATCVTTTCGSTLRQSNGPACS